MDNNTAKNLLGFAWLGKIKEKWFNLDISRKKACKGILDLNLQTLAFKHQAVVKYNQEKRKEWFYWNKELINNC